MWLKELNLRVDKYLCAAFCRDSADAKKGKVNRKTRTDLLKLSIAREFSEMWCHERQYRYKCWVYETFGI